MKKWGILSTVGIEALTEKQSDYGLMLLRARYNAQRHPLLFEVEGGYDFFKTLDGIDDIYLAAKYLVTAESFAIEEGTPVHKVKFLMEHIKAAQRESAADSEYQDRIDFARRLQA